MKSKIKTKTKKKETKIVSSNILVNRIKQKEGKSVPIKQSKIEVDAIVRRFLREVNKALIAGEEIRLVGSFTLKTAIRPSK